MTSIRRYSNVFSNEIQDIPALKSLFYGDLRVLARKLSSPFGPPMQVSMQVRLALNVSCSDPFVVFPQVSAASEPGSECERVPLLSDHSSSTGGVSSVRWRSHFNSNHIRRQV